MAALNITDADVRAEHERRHGPDVDLDSRTARAIRRDLAQQAMDAKKKPAAADTAPPPDHRTITCEVAHGDRVIAVTQHHVPIPTTT